MCWEDFKARIGKEFGLSSSQLSARYFGMKPQTKESAASFVLRVE